MKAGIWGAGFIAHTHAEALKGEGVTLGAVVDVDLKCAAELAGRWGAEAYSTDSDILFRDDITAVHVCTPPNLHYEMVKQLLDAGKHVLCEKPLCFENEQAEKLVLVAKEKSLVCAVNYNVRYHGACQTAMEIVSSADFGKVLLVHGSYLQEFHALPAQTGWRYSAELAGKMRAVTEIGSHCMDISQYISGKKITHVSAMFANFHPTRIIDNDMMLNPEINKTGNTCDVISEDVATVNIRFEDGAIGSAVFSEVSQGRINRLSLEVTGENSNLWWNSEDNNLLHTAQKGTGVNTRIFAFGNGFTDTFRSLLKEFYKDVRLGVISDKPDYPCFEEGALIVRLCNALYESAQNDAKWIEV